MRITTRNRRIHVPLRERWEHAVAGCRRVVAATWRPALAVAAGAAVIVGGIAAWRTLRTTDHFLLRTLDVKGNERLPDAEIAAACGLGVGATDLLFADGDAIAAACESDPRLRVAHAEVEPPDRVVVRVEEQDTAMFVATDSGLWKVNGYGEVYAPAGVLEYEDLPLLVGSPAAEEAAATSDGVVRDALALVRTVSNPASPWEGLSLLIEYDPDVGFRVSASGRGLRAQFGPAPFPRKFERLVEALDVAAGNLLVVEEALLDNVARPNAVTLKIALSGPVAAAAGGSDR